MSFPGVRGPAARRRLPAARSDALALLEGAGCPICRTTEVSTRRWFASFQEETRTDVVMRERLGRSRGFCTVHTRQLLDLGTGTAWVARWVFTDVATAAHAALGGTPAPVETCPACVAAARVREDNLRVLAGSLAEPEVAKAYDGGDGCCLTHGSALLRLAAPPVAKAVGSRLLDELESDAEALLTGSDSDVARRDRLRSGAEPAGTGEGECCPVCARVAETERGYLQWLADGTGDSELQAREAALCTGHLADLPAGSGAEVVRGHLGAVWAKELGGFVDASVAGSARQVHRAAATLGKSIGCRLCELCVAAAGREHRRLRLLAEDPASADRLPAFHGVCLRHAQGSDLPAWWRRLLRGRLGLLAHELQESERKAGWEARWEVKGPEMTAWRRAPTLLDGGVLLGTYSGA